LVSELRESSIHFLESPDGTKEDPQASPKTVVEETTQDLDFPLEAMREEEQDHSEDEEDRASLMEHENEEEQPNGVLFTSE